MRLLLNLLYQVLDFCWQFFFSLIQINDSILASFLRRKIYKTNCRIETNVFIKNRRNFISGHNSCLYHSCYILNTYGKVIIGNHSHLGAFCYINVCYGNVTIGDHVAIGPGTKIIAYSNSYERAKKITEVRIVEDITIGNNVFIGANCIILPGTVVQDNVVIGAGSLVKGILNANSLYTGIPCKQIRTGWYE